MSDSELPRYLEQLEEALFDLPDDADAMILSEVDGYVTGLALLPVEVPPAEWLPAIWRPDPDTPDYLYHDQALLDEIATNATRHFRAVARDLHRGELVPIYEVSSFSDETFWEFWIEGFGRAMELRPDGFPGIDNAPEDVRAAYGGLLLLSWIAQNNATDDNADGAQNGATSPSQISELETFSEEDRKALVADAPDLLPMWVQALYEWTRPTRPTPGFAVPARSQKVGRNDPCPCGSGKKYKKCCGAAA